MLPRVHFLLAPRYFLLHFHTIIVQVFLRVPLFTHCSFAILHNLTRLSMSQCVANRRFGRIVAIPMGTIRFTRTWLGWIFPRPKPTTRLPRLPFPQP